jgi:bacteriocin-like protein
MGDKPTHPTKQSIDNKDEQAKKTAKKQGEQLSEEDLDKVSGGHLGIRR